MSRFEDRTRTNVPFDNYRTRKFCINFYEHREHIVQESIHNVTYLTKNYLSVKTTFTDVNKLVASDAKRKHHLTLHTRAPQTPQS